MKFVGVDYNLVKTEAGMQKIDISRKESLANYNIALCNLYFWFKTVEIWSLLKNMPTFHIEYVEISEGSFLAILQSHCLETIDWLFDKIFLFYIMDEIFKWLKEEMKSSVTCDYSLLNNTLDGMA